MKDDPQNNSSKKIPLDIEPDSSHVKAFGHIPRDFRYIDLPKERIPYDEYITWLTHYLLENEFDLSPSQFAFIQKKNYKDPRDIFLDISDNVGYQSDPIYSFEEDICNGMTFDEMHNFELKMLEQDKENVDPEDFELHCKEILTTREEYQQMCDEVAILGNVPYIEREVDKPYRPMLAFALKSCKDFEEARKEVKFFFDNYSDCSMK